jgi:hypothetical protein
VTSDGFRQPTATGGDDKMVAASKQRTPKMTAHPGRIPHEQDRMPR